MEEIDRTSNDKQQSPLVFIVVKRNKAVTNPSQFSKMYELDAPEPTLNEKLVEDQGKKQCRICLQGVGSKDTIKTCKCTGNCLKQWILKLLQKKSPVECEFCKTPYDYVCKVEKRISCTQFWVNWQKNKREICCYLAIYFLLTLFLLAFIIVLIVANKGESKLTQKLVNNQGIFLFYIAGLILCLILLIIVTVIFLNGYCSEKHKSIILLKHSNNRFKILNKQSRDHISTVVQKRLRQTTKVIRI